MTNIIEFPVIRRKAQTYIQKMGRAGAEMYLKQLIKELNEAKTGREIKRCTDLILIFRKELENQVE
jgi:hypothetical protein